MFGYISAPVVRHSLFKVAVSTLETPNFLSNLAIAVMVSQLSQALLFFLVVKCPLLEDGLKALTGDHALFGKSKILRVERTKAAQTRRHGVRLCRFTPCGICFDMYLP